MSLQIGEQPLATFAQPLTMLRDCHRRVERFLDQLARVAGGPAGALAAVRRTALEEALRYFREAAPKHTADEEESLFPRLRTGTGTVPEVALKSLAALHAEHEAATPLHARVDELGRRWLEQDSLTAAEQAELAAQVARLQALYAGHIAVEEQEVFPLAERALSPDQLREVGREMAGRRQVSPAGTHS